MDGGAGYDYASYFSATAAVVIHRVTPTNGSGEAQGDTYANIEAFRLTAGFADRFVGGSGAEAAYGGGGNDTLSGGGGTDFLDGEENDGRLTGGAGNDTFAFYERGFGRGTVTDFMTGDVNEFSVSAFASFNDVRSHMTQSGSNAIITPDGPNTVTLQNVTATGLTAGSFHFVQERRGRSRRDHLKVRRADRSAPASGRIGAPGPPQTPDASERRSYSVLSRARIAECAYILALMGRVIHAAKVTDSPYASAQTTIRIAASALRIQAQPAPHGDSSYRSAGTGIRSGDVAARQQRLRTFAGITNPCCSS